MVSRVSSQVAADVNKGEGSSRISEKKTIMSQTQLSPLQLDPTLPENRSTENKAWWKCAVYA
jgi:hypothetical protein